MKKANFLGFKNAAEMINYLKSTGNCNMETLIKTLHTYSPDNEPYLPEKMYKFTDGPFKGHKFISTAPNVKLMNEYPWFTLEFIDGRFKGLKCSNIISYDRNIIEIKEPKWVQLLKGTYGY
ncbi:hypothetical protein AVV36_gp128 [Pectobacterium bacteriophage PM2]|uniref:Uncharacterized protein n=1 Tax=Pectobacterium bacteriophage PM2 TaxID=1429794 RepID=A0A0A0Q2F2_9CAUD|nr:hypothetical protein AVV36_gp128 [Pectobacterium bacteriophage PM2]AHY25090.1 hypothetical protein PM2_128 [Pectobacterium bacteriophage PM2]